MEAFAKRQNRTIVLMLQGWWADHRTTLLGLAVVLMAIAALVWLTYEFWRLLWPSPPVWRSSPSGAVDLRLRHVEVQRWFAGLPVYSVLPSALYPPASYVILGPLLGWLALTPARWLWAVTTLVMLAWLVSLTIRASGAQTRLERVFVAFIPLSMYATGATIGNGQVIVHLLPLLVAGLLMLDDTQCAWREDVIAAVLILLALVKPSISAPFFWIVLFVPGRLRPALLV
ncbi:MAG: glycosyltransferase 87 family protein, partial [Candidatus Binatia bacterium]